MNAVERMSIYLRHRSGLAQAHWLWNRVRPIYNEIITVIGRNGLRRNMNGTDRLLLLPRFRGVPEEYEPDTWHWLMTQVRLGDIVVDVGAYIGLYAIALANRVGPTGHVIALEPDPHSFADLKSHVELNHLADRIVLIQAAAGATDGNIHFENAGNSESHVSAARGSTAGVMRCTQLDTLFSNRSERWPTILKIDVEGFEEQVLRGATALLHNPQKAPRLLLIEVHPYAWKNYGASSDSLLALLNDAGYAVTDLSGERVDQITTYGHVVARQAKHAASKTG